MARYITEAQEDAILSGAAGVPELFAGAAGVPELFAGAAGAPELFSGAAGFGGYDFASHKGFLTPGLRANLERRCKEAGICNNSQRLQYNNLRNEISAEYCVLVQSQNNGVGPSGQRSGDFGGSGCGGIWPANHQAAVSQSAEAAWKSGRRPGSSGGAKKSNTMFYAVAGVGALIAIWAFTRKEGK